MKGQVIDRTIDKRIAKGISLTTFNKQATGA
jgi:hypothetical protein